MEMVKTEIIAVLLLAGVCSCSGPGITWRKTVMDGSRTGVTAVVGEDVASALGTMEDSVYVSPSGRSFSEGSVPGVAKALLEVQPRLSGLKEVICLSREAMGKDGDESLLCNWAADAVRTGVEEACGRRVDVCIINKGGLRIDIPEGEVMVDDVVSLFPFRNYLSWVLLQGSDLRALLEQFAADPQAISGARLVISDGKLESAEVGGKPLDDSAMYGVGTVDFLLDGGDGYKIARNAKDIVISKVIVKEWMVPYLRKLGQEGKMMESSIDGRVTVK